MGQEVKLNVGNYPRYGSIAYDIKSVNDDNTNLALSMMTSAKEYADHFGIVFEDGSELYFSKLSFNPETRTMIRSKL